MKKLLLVEDNPQVRMLVSLILRSEGMEIVECHHGEQALQRLQAGQPYDLIILDMMIPLVDGKQLLGYIQSDAVHAGTPVMILSSLSADDDILSAYNAGAAQYLCKPFEPDDLVLHVKRLLGMRRAPIVRLTA
jgi:DNA-binding response OmpR family regulator